MHFLKQLGRRNTMSITHLPVPEFTQLHIDTSYPSPDTARIAVAVAVAGEVDLASAPILLERLLSLLHEQAPAVLDVDLAGCTFLDCAGIGALVGARNAAVQTGCRLRVTNPRPIVRRVLELTGLLDVLAAPIDQPRLRPTGLGYQAGIGSPPVTVTTLPDMLVAA
jgi:anti-anti-sigma factor